MGSIVARKRIYALQEAILSTFSEAEVEAAVLACEVKHYFAPGVYIREMFMPQGTLVVGKKHKHAHSNILSLGVVKVVSEFDEFTAMAPYTFVSEAGTKRALVATTDVMWTTIHPNPTDTRDLRLLESQIIEEESLCHSLR